jgi:hypothetical protein
MMIKEYIFLAAGCVSFGIVITFIVLGVCQHLGLSIDQHYWIVAIPVVLSLFINVMFIELYRKFVKRK